MNPDQRISLQRVSSHPWLVGEDQTSHNSQTSSSSLSQTSSGSLQAENILMCNNNGVYGGQDCSTAVSTVSLQHHNLQNNTLQTQDHSPTNYYGCISLYPISTKSATTVDNITSKSYPNCSYIGQNLHYHLQTHRSHHQQPQTMTKPVSVPFTSSSDRKYCYNSVSSSYSSL